MCDQLAEQQRDGLTGRQEQATGPLRMPSWPALRGKVVAFRRRERVPCWSRSSKLELRWYPRGNCILAQPDRDVAAAPEATLVLPPVPDSVLLLVLAVDSARLRCDHDVTPPISMMDWPPPPPLACSLTPIHAPTPRRDQAANPWCGTRVFAIRRRVGRSLGGLSPRLSTTPVSCFLASGSS